MPAEHHSHTVGCPPPHGQPRRRELHRRVATLATVLCLALLSAAGCGVGASEDDRSRTQYEARVQQIAHDAGGPPAAHQDDPVAAMRRVAEQLDVTAPPDEVADAHRLLVSGLRRMAAALDGQPAATVAPDDAVTESLTALDELEGAAHDIARADRMFRARGYDISAITGTEAVDTEREVLADLAPSDGSSVR